MVKVLKTTAFCLPVNPEPWAIGSAYVRRGGGKAFASIAPDKTLKTYQEAVRSELMARGASLLEPPYALEFYFWRQNAQYQSPKGRTMTRNTPDTTNMQKATEDAIQGVLIGNDRDVLAVKSHRVEASTEGAGQVVIVVHHLEPAGIAFPIYVYDAIATERARQENQQRNAADSNTWLP